MNPNEQAIAELWAAENRRTTALTKQDFDTLRELLPEDLTHVHSNGHCQNREELFDRMQKVLEFVRIERFDLKYRFYGDAAVVVGPMRITIRWRETGVENTAMSTVSQTWVRQNGRWIQVAFQSAKHP